MIRTFKIHPSKREEIIAELTYLLKRRLVEVGRKLKKVKLEKRNLRRQFQQEIKTKLSEDYMRLRQVEDDLKEINFERHQKELILQDIIETRVTSEPKYLEPPIKQDIKKIFSLLGLLV